MVKRWSFLILFWKRPMRDRIAVSHAHLLRWPVLVLVFALGEALDEECLDLVDDLRCLGWEGGLHEPHACLSSCVLIAGTECELYDMGRTLWRNDIVHWAALGSRHAESWLATAELSEQARVFLRSVVSRGKQVPKSPTKECSLVDGLSQGMVPVLKLHETGSLAEGGGPMRALKALCLQDMSAPDRVIWLEKARVDSILGATSGSLPSVRSGIRCYLAFVTAVAPDTLNFFPPQLGLLIAWSRLFRVRGVFSNYLGYVRTGCMLVKAPTEVRHACGATYAGLRCVCRAGL